MVEEGRTAARSVTLGQPGEIGRATAAASSQPTQRQPSGRRWWDPWASTHDGCVGAPVQTLVDGRPARSSNGAGDSKTRPAASRYQRNPEHKVEPI